MPHAVRQHTERAAPENGAVRVLTVDDDAAYRDLVRAVIGATSGFRMVGEASCGEDGVTMAAVLRPELVLMDVRMPGIGGIEAARRITAGGDDRVAIVLMSADPRVLTPDSLSGRTIGLLRKERMGPRALREIWEASSVGRRS